MSDRYTNILVIQLARIGDTLQSTPLIRGLKQRYPNARLTALIVPGSERILEGNPDIDEIIHSDNSALTDSLIRGGGNDLIACFHKLEKWLNEIRARNFDLVINLTHSPFSALLCRYLRPPEMSGLTLADDFRRVIRGSWPNYFFNMVFNRGTNEFNLVDLYRKFGGDVPPVQAPSFTVTEADRAAAEKLFAKHDLSPGDRVIAFQLGASVEDRRWPTRHFAALGDRLVEEMKARILLLGTQSEAGLGREVVSRMKAEATDTSGETNLGEAAAVLERCRLLVTNDTGIMHLASCLPIKIVELSMSKVYYKETGPYGAGHVVAQARIDCAPCHADFVCPHTMCRDYISPGAAFTAVKLALDDSLEAMEPLSDSSELETVELMVSRFTPRGFIEYAPLISRPVEVQNLVNLAYRLMWQDVFDGKAEVNAETEEIGSYLASFKSPTEDLSPAISEIDQSFESIVQLGREGRKLCVGIAEGLMSRSIQVDAAKEEVKKLTALNARIRAFGRTFEPTRALTSFFQFESQNIEGVDPLRVAQETLLCYEQLEAQAGMLRKKLAQVMRSIEASVR